MAVPQKRKIAQTAGRRVRPAAASVAAEEDSDDLGQAESRRFPDLGIWKRDLRAEETKKSKEFLDKFDREVERMHSEISSMLLEAEQSMIQAEKENIRPLVEARDGGSSASPGALDEAAVAEVLRACREILDHYDRTIDSIPPNQHMSRTRARWQQDGEWVEQLIRYGRQYGEGVAQGLVLPHRDPAAALAVDVETLSEPAKVAVGMFQKSGENLRKKTWGNTARAQVNAVSATLKRVLLDDDE